MRVHLHIYGIDPYQEQWQTKLWLGKPYYKHSHSVGDSYWAGCHTHVIYTIKKHNFSRFPTNKNATNPLENKPENCQAFFPISSISNTKFRLSWVTRGTRWLSTRKNGHLKKTIVGWTSWNLGSGQAYLRWGLGGGKVDDDIRWFKYSWRCLCQMLITCFFNE